jgi:uncharacterized protein YyaL (SSP411 family)
MSGDGRLMHAFRSGEARAPAVASDYANMIRAASALHQATGDAGYLDDARGWLDVLDRHYWMPESGGYAMTADDTAGLIVRTHTAQDDATPNANGVMMSNLMALFLMTGESRYVERAEAILAAHTGLLAGAMDLVAPQHVVVLDGINGAAGKAEALAAALERVSLPGAVRERIVDATRVPAGSPLTGNLPNRDDGVALICIGPQCSAPITDPASAADKARLLRTSRTS